MKAERQEMPINKKERPCKDCPIEPTLFKPDDLCDDILAIAKMASANLLNAEEKALFEKNFRALLEERLELHFQNDDCLTATQMNILLNEVIAMQCRLRALEEKENTPNNIQLMDLPPILGKGPK